MTRKLTLRQALLWILALRADVSHKQIGARIGISEARVSQFLRRKRRLEIKDEDFEKLLGAIPHKPAEVTILTELLEALEALEDTGGLTDEQTAGVELEVLEGARLMREDLREVLRRVTSLTFDGYPEPADLTPARLLAEEQWERLRGLTPEARLAVVQGSERFQSYALCVKVCDLSTEAAARDLEEAAALAGLAREIAERVRGPESWHNAMKGYATAPGANILRVKGELIEARVTMEEAKRLWRRGSDPAGVLDPGRLLDLEASLCRDERRCGEALTLLDEALAVGRHPERVLVSKGFTLEVMGEYERAAETLLRAIDRIDRRTEPRLWNIARLNLANNHGHLGRYQEAADLIRTVRPFVIERGDKLDLIRLGGIEARLTAALGRPEEALRRLRQAREQFAENGMTYDVALAALEEAVLLLDLGQVDQVRRLANELKAIFSSRGVHREALVALRLFQEAADRDQPSAELARRVLRYLYRARYDEDLSFNAS